VCHSEYVSYRQGPYRIRIVSAADHIVPALVVNGKSFIASQFQIVEVLGPFPASLFRQGKYFLKYKKFTMEDNPNNGITGIYRQQKTNKKQNLWYSYVNHSAFLGFYSLLKV